MTPTEPPENATGLDGKENGAEAQTSGGALESPPRSEARAGCGSKRTKFEHAGTASKGKDQGRC